MSLVKILVVECRDRPANPRRPHLKTLRYTYKDLLVCFRNRVTFAGSGDQDMDVPFWESPLKPPRRHSFVSPVSKSAGHAAAVPWVTRVWCGGLEVGLAPRGSIGTILSKMLGMRSTSSPSWTLKIAARLIRAKRSLLSLRNFYQDILCHRFNLACSQYAGVS